MATIVWWILVVRSRATTAARWERENSDPVHIPTVPYSLYPITRLLHILYIQVIYLYIFIGPKYTQIRTRLYGYVFIYIRVYVHNVYESVIYHYSVHSLRRSPYIFMDQSSSSCAWILQAYSDLEMFQIIYKQKKMQFNYFSWDPVWWIVHAFSSFSAHLFSAKSSIL